jgi:phosphate transport system substrate-binding protein
MRKTFTTLIALGAIGALIAGCGGGREEDTSGEAIDTAAASGEALSGNIVVDGSSTVTPVMTLAAEKFEGAQPDVTVTVGTSGTGGGFEKFCNDETDISMASRPIKDEEVQACADKGIDYTELTVSNDGLAVVANKENDWAQCLTVDQLAAIWGPDSKLANWNEVDPSFPDVPLKLFGPGTDSGTFDYFTDEINGEEGASRTDFQASEDDNVIVQGVSGEPGGLGYFGLSYYLENEDKLNLVQVDGGNGCVTASTETVQGGTYTPLGRSLFIYVKSTSLERPEVKGMLEFFAANEAALNEEALFVPLSSEQADGLAAAVNG